VWERGVGGWRTYEMVMEGDKGEGTAQTYAQLVTDHGGPPHGWVCAGLVPHGCLRQAASSPKDRPVTGSVSD